MFKQQLAEIQCYNVDLEVKLRGAVVDSKQLEERISQTSISTEKIKADI